MNTKNTKVVKAWAVVMRDTNEFLRAYYRKDLADRDVGPAVFSKVVPVEIRFTNKKAKR